MKWLSLNLLDGIGGLDAYGNPVICIQGIGTSECGAYDVQVCFLYQLLQKWGNGIKMLSSLVG